MKKWFNKNRAFVLSEVIFVLVAAGFFYFYFRPASISPSSGLVIDTFDLNFEVENADKIVLSRSLDFKEKIYVENGKDVLLIPGTYYWKAVSNLGESEVRNFTITTSLVLSLYENEGKYSVRNKGNVDANVTHGEESKIVEVGENEIFDNGNIDNGNRTIEGRAV